MCLETTIRQPIPVSARIKSGCYDFFRLHSGLKPLDALCLKNALKFTQYTSCIEKGDL